MATRAPSVLRSRRRSQEQGWGEKVNKTHFNTVNEMSAFAEAALKLGEKPFKGGGMK